MAFRLGELVDHKWADETPERRAGVRLYRSGQLRPGRSTSSTGPETKRLWPDRKTISASGHVDPGETFEQAAVREVGEELGIELSESDLRLLGCVHRSGSLRPGL